MLERETVIKRSTKEQIEIKIQEIPFVEKINLRFDPNNKDLVSICTNILENILPIKPNTYTENTNLKIIWLGPDEWLIVNGNKNNLYENLRNKLGDLDASITNVSENRTIIRVSGKKINILLSKFLTLDLEKNLSTIGSCAQTLFVKVPVLLLVNNYDKDQEIDIFVNRSHTKYIYDILIDGSKNLDF